MIRSTLVLLLVVSAVFGFTIDHPGQLPRIRDTRVFAAAAASRPRVEPSKSITVTSPTGRPNIVELNGAEEFRNFLEEDDRLTMVK